MKCPYCCYEESKVIDSRPTDEGERIRRRRECLKCQKRFTTYEVIESLPLIVIKRDFGIFKSSTIDMLHLLSTSNPSICNPRHFIRYIPLDIKTFLFQRVLFKLIDFYCFIAFTQHTIYKMQR